MQAPVLPQLPLPTAEWNEMILSPEAAVLLSAYPTLFRARDKRSVLLLSPLGTQSQVSPAMLPRYSGLQAEVRRDALVVAACHLGTTPCENSSVARHSPRSILSSRTRPQSFLPQQTLLDACLRSDHYALAHGEPRKASKTRRARASCLAGYTDASAFGKQF